MKYLRALKHLTFGELVSIGIVLSLPAILLYGLLA